MYNSHMETGEYDGRKLYTSPSEITYTPMSDYDLAKTVNYILVDGDYKSELRKVEQETYARIKEQNK